MDTTVCQQPKNVQIRLHGCSPTDEALLMSTHNICFCREIRKIFTRYPPLTRPMHTPLSIPLPGKKKIENFHVFDIHWLYRTSRYAIVKVDVTEHYDVSKSHSIDITIWRSVCIIKHPLPEIKGWQEKEPIIDVRDRQKNQSLGITV